MQTIKDISKFVSPVEKISREKLILDGFPISLAFQYLMTFQYLMNLESC